MSATGGLLAGFRLLAPLGENAALEDDFVHDVPARILVEPLRLDSGTQPLVELEGSRSGPERLPLDLECESAGSMDAPLVTLGDTRSAGFT